jgi:nitrite reductase/ring-hydroxylating ferredoxin subunit
MRQALPVRVGRYVRDLGASLTRMIENALDWEHLPHLHASSFASIRLIEADASGWRAEATLPGDPRPLVLDLRLDDNGWVTQTTRGVDLLSEIRTVAEATGERSCRVYVDFHVVGIGETRRADVGAYYQQLYARLYDEDEAMMIARQAAIDTGAATRGDWRMTSLTDGDYPVPRACPHLALPLNAEPDANGIVTCPWHGYRFDVRTGRCVSGKECGWKAPRSTA